MIETQKERSRFIATVAAAAVHFDESTSEVLDVLLDSHRLLFLVLLVVDVSSNFSLGAMFSAIMKRLAGPLADFDYLILASAIMTFSQYS